MVEAAGIEPASEDVSVQTYYMLSPSFIDSPLRSASGLAHRSRYAELLLPFRHRHSWKDRPAGWRPSPLAGYHGWDALLSIRQREPILDWQLFLTGF